MIPEQYQSDFDAMPQVLRELLLAELVAGNTIAEVGHSFPAPPVGAYFLMTHPIRSRRRESSEGLVFYERNSSSYSGEFTDAQRFFFILEPPGPPEPYPDMDAIRKRLEDASQATAPRASNDVAEQSTAEPAETSPMAKPSIPSRQPRQSPSPTKLDFRTTATQAGCNVVVRDQRDPNAMRMLLERRIIALFALSMEDDRLIMRCQTKQMGASYKLLLRFDSSASEWYYYTIHIEADWGSMPPDSHDYFRKTSTSWFQLWLRDFQQVSDSPPADNAARYQSICQSTFQSDEDLATIDAIQRRIVQEMKQGRYFATSHKEGGTTIRWTVSRFRRADYDESTDTQDFATEAEFLPFLLNFFWWDVSRSVLPGRVSELDAWKLILRLLLE